MAVYRNQAERNLIGTMLRLGCDPETNQAEIIREVTTEVYPSDFASGLMRRIFEMVTEQQTMNPFEILGGLPANHKINDAMLWDLVTDAPDRPVGDGAAIHWGYYVSSFGNGRPEPIEAC